MAKDRRPAEDLSIEELEALLARKRLEARQERVSKFQRTGRAMRLREESAPTSRVEDLRTVAEGMAADGGSDETGETARGRKRALFNRSLLAIEVTAALGLVFVLFSGVDALQTLNEEAAQGLRGSTPEPTPLITAVVLPSGHTPPGSPGGAQPNEAEIPENLRPIVQSLPVIPIPTAGPDHARSIFIPAIWQAAAPIVQGDGWEQLRRGVGQHIGSGNPGEPGNVVLSAHNDIYGQLFRDLDQLEPGDEIILSTPTQDFTYRVTEWRIVEPTEVDVMLPTARPTVTLISCYPYLVDTQRIVVFGELAEG
jgi:sortase A